MSGSIALSWPGTGGVESAETPETLIEKDPPPGNHCGFGRKEG